MFELMNKMGEKSFNQAEDVVAYSCLISDDKEMREKERDGGRGGWMEQELQRKSEEPEGPGSKWHFDKETRRSEGRGVEGKMRA